MARTALRRTTTPPGSSTFCYWVKRWRAYRGVTQREFAALWGVSPSLVQKIEADDYSVSQLSFERLETLRTLLQLPSSTFYGLIATHPDAPVAPAGEPPEHDQVQVARLEPGLPPVSLPRSLFARARLSRRAEPQLRAFAVLPTDFATDRLRYSLQVGTLVVFTPVWSPQPGDVCAALTASEQGRRVLWSYHPDRAAFLRAFDPENDTVLEPSPHDLEVLGVVVASWVTFAASR